MHDPHCVQLIRAHDNKRSGYLLIQIDMPELWVQAKACGVNVAVGTLPAVLYHRLHSRLQPLR